MKTKQNQKLCPNVSGCDAPHKTMVIRSTVQPHGWQTQLRSAWWDTTRCNTPRPAWRNAAAVFSACHKRRLNGMWRGDRAPLASTFTPMVTQDMTSEAATALWGRYQSGIDTRNVLTTLTNSTYLCRALVNKLSIENKNLSQLILQKNGKLSIPTAKSINGRMQQPFRYISLIHEMKYITFPDTIFSYIWMGWSAKNGG